MELLSAQGQGQGMGLMPQQSTAQGVYNRTTPPRGGGAPIQPRGISGPVLGSATPPFRPPAIPAQGGGLPLFTGAVQPSGAAPLYTAFPPQGAGGAGGQAGVGTGAGAGAGGGGQEAKTYYSLDPRTLYSFAPEYYVPGDAGSARARQAALEAIQSSNGGFTPYSAAFKFGPARGPKGFGPSALQRNFDALKPAERKAVISALRDAGALGTAGAGQQYSQEYLRGMCEGGNACRIPRDAINSSRFHTALSALATSNPQALSELLNGAYAPGDYIRRTLEETGEGPAIQASLDAVTHYPDIPKRPGSKRRRLYEAIDQTGRPVSSDLIDPNRALSAEVVGAKLANPDPQKDAIARLAVDQAKVKMLSGTRLVDTTLTRDRGILPPTNAALSSTFRHRADQFLYPLVIGDRAYLRALVGILSQGRDQGTLQAAQARAKLLAEADLRKEEGLSQIGQESLNAARWKIATSSLRGLSGQRAIQTTSNGQTADARLGASLARFREESKLTPSQRRKRRQSQRIAVQPNIGAYQDNLAFVARNPGALEGIMLPFEGEE